MMKKFVILIFCLLVGLAMTGCGNKTTVEKKVLRVATTANFPPFEYFQPNSGIHTGYDIDLMRELGKNMGYDKVEFINVNFTKLLEGLEAKEYDAVIAYGITCYKPTGSCDEDSGYYDNLTDCKTTTIGCYQDETTGCYIRDKQCPTGQNLSSTDISMCNTVPDYVNVLKIASGDTSGTDICYECFYQCNTSKEGVYTSQTECINND